MLARFQQLQPRQQLLVVIAMILIIVLFYVRVLWLPLTDALLDKQRQYDIALQERQGVASLVMEIQALRNSGGGRESPPVLENLSSLVNTTLQARQLQLARIQQLTSGQVSVRLDNVEFAGALTWLFDLESTPGLVVGEVGIRPVSANQNGLVNVTVGLWQRNL